MSPRDRSKPRRPAPPVGAGLAAVTGLCLLTTGAYVLTQPSTVEAESFGPATVAETTTDPSPAQPDAPAQGEHTDEEAATATAMPAALPPKQLTFPDADVIADVVPVTTLPSGALQIPDDPTRVGWWAPGALPGQSEGSAVLAGHMNQDRHTAMSPILDLEPGQTITIEDHRGTAHEYRVTARDTAPRDSLDASLFTTDGPHRLVLITCGGTFNEDTGHYSENIVVTAEPLPPDGQ